MHKVWTLVIIMSVLLGALIVTRQEARAGALNESDLPEEADFCNVQFPVSAQVNGGVDVQIYGRIFEVGLTEGQDANPAILAEVGLGPNGSDPRFDDGSTFMPADFNLDVGTEDEYLGAVMAPSPADTTDYSYAYRFSMNGGADYTYCDLDGAGSNAGLDFSPGELGILTVNGSGGGTGAADGSVTTSVDVISDPGACILLDTASINYGELTFSTQNGTQSGGGIVNITSCSLTTPLDLFAKGTNASGPTANWELTTPPGSRNMCDGAAGGIDQFGQSLVHGQTLANLDLTHTNQSYATGLPVGQSLLTGIDLLMPCAGSSGTGETVSSTVTFTAIPGAPLPDDNPCAVDIPFIGEGTTQGDTTECPTFDGSEINPSCLDGVGALHRQYFAFELESAATGTLTVTSPWDAVVAVYEIDQDTNTAVEVDCANNALAGNPETVQAQNGNPIPTLYIVQVEGAVANEFGPYDINLVVTP